MKARNLLKLLLSAILCIALSGCSFQLLSSEKLIRPPLPFGDNQELKLVFEKAVGNNTVLKSAVAGDNMSAYMLADIDDDNVKEAVVFYADISNTELTRMLVLDEKDGEWTKVGIYDGQGSDIYSVDFIDMNNDGFLEIIVSWTIFESKGNKIFTIYKCISNDGKLSIIPIYSEAFFVKCNVDLDEDGRMNILFANIDNTAIIPSSAAKLIKLDDSGSSVSVISTVNLDSNIAGYLNPKLVNIGENQTAVFIDAKKGETGMITEIIYWDVNEKALVAPFTDAQTMSNTSTWRNANIECQDIDNDGNLDIPCQEVLKNSHTYQTLKEINSSYYYLTKWCRFYEGKLEIIKRNAINYNEKYVLEFKNGWPENISVKSYEKNREWHIYAQDKTENISECAFKIIAAESAVWDENFKKIYDKYVPVLSNQKRVIALMVTPFGITLGITVEDAKALIKEFV